MANDKAILIYATMPSLAVAEEIGGAVVDAGLAACVNLIPGMVSIYRWQGARQRDDEVVMVAKSVPALADRLVEAIRARHPYETPAIVVLPVAGGSAAFLDWIAASTIGSGGSVSDTLCQTRRAEPVDTSRTSDTSDGSAGTGV